MRTSKWALAAAALLLTGCGQYKLVFEVQDVINAPGDESRRQMLDVDVVTLTKEDSKAHPDVANGTMRSDEWFRARARATGSKSIGDLGKNQVSAMRGEGSEYANYTPDKRLGNPLSSVVEGGRREVPIEVHHGGFLAKESAIIVYGRFHDGKGGLLATDPVVISPPPPWNTTIHIDVGRTAMTWKNRQ